MTKSHKRNKERQREEEKVHNFRINFRTSFKIKITVIIIKNIINSNFQSFSLDERHYSLNQFKAVLKPLSKSVFRLMNESNYTTYNTDAGTINFCQIIIIATNLNRLRVPSVIAAYY